MIDALLSFPTILSAGTTMELRWHDFTLTTGLLQA